MIIYFAGSGYKSIELIQQKEVIGYSCVGVMLTYKDPAHKVWVSEQKETKESVEDGSEEE